MTNAPHFPARSLPALSLAAALLAACTTVPTGPSVMVLPGTGKTFEQFRVDNQDCRNYAQEQIGGTDAGQSAASAELKSAALGTAVGAVAGAAMGGHQGAGSGAGAGLLMGTMVGMGTADSSARGTQRQYDGAYTQCMYAKGHRVPVSGNLSSQPQGAPRASSMTPPPPPPPDSRYAPPDYAPR